MGHRLPSLSIFDHGKPLNPKNDELRPIIRIALRNWDVEQVWVSVRSSLGVLVSGVAWPNMLGRGLEPWGALANLSEKSSGVHTLSDAFRTHFEGCC